MPKLSDSSILLRQNQILRVMIAHLKDPQLNLEQACMAEGITPELFRYWVRKSPDAMDVLREYLNEAQREQLFQLAMSWNKGVQAVVADAVDPTTKPGDRVTSLKFVKQQLDELEATYHAAPGIEEEAQKFLKVGPKLKPIESRMTSIEVEPTPQGVNIRVSSNSSYKDVIDLTANPDEPETDPELPELPPGE